MSAVNAQTSCMKKKMISKGRIVYNAAQRINSISYGSLLRRGPLTDCFEYKRESAGEERKEPLPNNVCESVFQRTNRAILSSANFFTIYQGRYFSSNGNVSCCSGKR